jgi:shikimate kinase
MNITLIGMSGAGKSYIGKRLAGRLGLTFTDIDDLIAEKHGKPIQQVLEELGEDAYLDTETERLIAGTAGREGLVISPGGSVVYCERAMRYIRDMSHAIYLQVPYETIEERNRNAPPHAIIGLGKKTLRELYDERHPLYLRHADLVVDAHGKRADAILSAIIDFTRAVDSTHARR